MEKVEVSVVKQKIEECLNEGTAEIRLKDHKRTGSINVRDYTDIETG